MTKVDQSAGPDACWPWTKSHDRDGYAVTKIAGRQWRVARWVLTQSLGRNLTDGEVTRHTCDNRTCCNPAHLLVGTARDNSQDAIERERLITGEAHWARQAPERFHGSNNPAARLTEDQVRSIRARYAEGARQVDLAADFGVTQGFISQIIRRAAWAHIE